MKDIIINTKIKITLSIILLTIGIVVAKNYVTLPPAAKEPVKVKPATSPHQGSGQPHRSMVPKSAKKDFILKKDKKGNHLIIWDVLAEYDLKKKTQGKNLKKVVNTNVSLKGFMVPLDYSAKEIKEFLLVPFVPNCSHVPPPPVNLIVKVKMKGKSKAKNSYYPVVVIGKLTIPKRKKAPDPYMMEGVYELEATSLKESKN